MENIKFISKITCGIERKKIVLGNCIYYNLDNGNKIKTFCYSDGTHIDVINKIVGKIDSLDLPFRNYFEPTSCSKKAPQFYQYIDNNKWYSSEMYKHVLPTQNDYDSISKAIESCIEMYE